MTTRDFIKTPMPALAACLTAVVLMTGCSSLKTPATADVAVSRAAVDNAASAGAADLAPDEMRSAREKMRMANQALKDRDYKTARELADQAQADAKLAQSKANSAKATSAVQTGARPGRPGASRCQAGAKQGQLGQGHQRRR